MSGSGRSGAVRPSGTAEYPADRPGSFISHQEQIMQLDDADHERYLALPDDDDAGNRHTGVLVPVDATWPLHCDLPMWWRGGSVREFYCDCGHHRAPKRSEVREAGRA